MQADGVHSSPLLFSTLSEPVMRNKQKVQLELKLIKKRQNCEVK